MKQKPYNQNSNGSPLFRRAMAVALVLWLTGLTSCGKKEEAGKSSDVAALDLKGIQQHYQSATHYHDNARILLQYSLSGNPFEEVHAFSSQLVRSKAFLIHRFRCEITADDDQSLARILDSKSQNLDGQVLYAEQPLGDFLTKLDASKIGRHFLLGSDDIPWKKNVGADKIESVAGLPRLLFEGRPPSWFDSSQIKQTTSVQVEGIEYVDAVFDSDWGEISCRIDPLKKAVVGIRLPVSLLAPQIAEAPDVSGVSFAILFEQLSFETFKEPLVQVRHGEKPVSEFVKLPEEFPSQTIGTPMQDWQLLGIDGRSLDIRSAQGAPAIYLYGLPQQLTAAEVSTIESLSQEHPYANFAWVFPPSIPFDKSGASFSRMGYFSDAKGQMLQQVAPRSSTFFLIANESGEIQFVSRKKKNWLQEVGPLLKRIQRGDNVAKEMHHEYAKYFEEYEKKLRAVSVKHLIAQ